MRLLEYEAKTIVQQFGIPMPKSTIVRSDNDILELPVVLKSQVPVGGRGKAGGIRIVENPGLLNQTINSLFSLEIKGFRPNVLLAEEKLEILEEYYLSILIDKSDAQIKLMAHKNGGIEVEENDHDTFLAITFENLDTIGEQLAEYYDLPTQSFALQDMIENLYKCFIKNDATLIEINPLIYAANKKLVAGDCKMELDSVAAFRHPEWNFEEKPINANFVTLNEDGTVATIANGAGLAMATVDAVSDFGMIPANFLDIGGGANSASVLAAFQKIMGYSNVKAIVINIFAGITRCDEVAKAIIAAKEQIADLPPLYIRLAGTNVEQARSLLAKHNIPLLTSLEACLGAAKKEISHE